MIILGEDFNFSMPKNQNGAFVGVFQIEGDAPNRVFQVFARNDGPSNVLVYAAQSVTGAGGWSTCLTGAFGSLGIPLVAGAEGTFSFRVEGASRFASIVVWDGGLNLGCTGMARLLTADERAPINP